MTGPEGRASPEGRFTSVAEEARGDSAAGNGRVRLEMADISKRLKAALADLAEFDLVVGVATGGTVLASLSAYELGLPLQLMRLNYRAEDGTPRRKGPELLEPFLLAGRRRILLVDDVSVTGATFQAAFSHLKGHSARTLVLKGRADTVLYPEVTRCVLLPWRD